MCEEQVAGLVLGLTAGAVGLLVHEVTRRAASGRLRRSPWVGLRTARTLASDDAWVDGHRAALPWTRRTAWATVVLGVVTVVLAVSGAVAPAVATGLLAMAAVIAGSLLGTVAAHRAS